LDAFQIQWTKSGCIGTIGDTIAKYGAPEEYTTRSGSSIYRGQFTSMCSQENNIQISTDGKGRPWDNILHRTFWKSNQYEKIISESSKPGVLDLYQMVREYIEFLIIPKEGIPK